MRRVPRPKIIFITGTDTGVGKTVLTSLLLSHLRHKHGVVLAIKPFCSGSRRDAEILLALQSGELTINEINPFYFPEPVAPLISGRKNRREISLGDALNSIRKIVKNLQKPGISSATVNDSHRPILLIEGAGGLLVPLGKGFTTLELIKALGCEVVVVARNRLGTINHTLLTIQALQRARKMKRKPSFSPAKNQDVRIKVVLMGSNHPDVSARSNPAVLREFLAPVPIIPIPFLGKNTLKMAEIRALSKKFKKTLARILV